MSNTEIVKSAVEQILGEYDSDNVDVIVNEENGELDIVYHSDCDSFLLRSTGVLADETDLKELAKALDRLSVGHVW